jgi:phosphoribosylaminoimidazole-succinocarboxamide synthase
MVMVECIARGYLAGSGLTAYEKGGAVSGVALPGGLVEGSRLPEPIFTPTTKVAPGEGHDEFITYADVERQVGAGVAAELKRITLEVYRRGSAIARDRGILIADTKVELGFAGGTLKIGDELLTPDSSRFWAADEWSPGGTQRYLDKQFLRDWSGTLSGWDRTAPGPEIPDQVVDATRRRYIEVYERLTGDRWR